jgi:hypothetical protein
LYPRTVPCFDLASNHRADDSVVTEMPQTTEQHRCVPSFPAECSA